MHLIKDKYVLNLQMGQEIIIVCKCHIQMAVT